MLRFIKAATERADRRYQALRDVATMQAMDERMLRDIGITRADIDEVRRRVRGRI
jgi:uncharacterized protein YjiS (DUF1127 family)